MAFARHRLSVPPMGLDDREPRATSAGYSHVQARANRAHGIPLALAARSAQHARSADEERLEQSLSAYFDLVWRTLRRFGVPASMADDAAQHVFLTLAARLDEVTLDKERAFLVGASIRVAANARRRGSERLRASMNRTSSTPTA